MSALFVDLLLITDTLLTFYSHKGQEHLFLSQSSLNICHILNYQLECNETFSIFYYTAVFSGLFSKSMIWEKLLLDISIE